MSIKVQDRLECLKTLREGTEQQVFATEVNIELGKRKIKEIEKKKASEPDEVKFAIEKKIIHNEENLKDLADGLEYLNEEIKNEEQKGK